MGTTLENGVYLPSEGERNCYAGLKTNWEILDQKVADVTALQQAVAGALHREIVESLPTTDIDPNTIYMVLSGTSATENVYNEFMYVNNAWELIGTSATDLTNYYTKGDVDGLLLLKANASDLISHTGDTTIHVTASDKAKWNNQTYVLRYSSTTLVASSTNSNSLLDNTDNLKVGDKVIDASGVIYSVTAIDTANSTFTIGTALIDLATDSDVVHKSGIETVDGFKQFANIRVTNSIKAINLENTTTDLNNCYSDFAFSDGSRAGNIQYYYCNTVSGTANISNLPEANAFFLTSITTRLTSNSLYVKQILINSNSKTFVRYCNNSTWSTWVNETDSEYVHKSGNENVNGIKNFKNMIPIDGDYLGNEASINQRTNICLRSNRDTADKSCAYISRFRQNKSQGALQTGDLQMIGFDVLENEVRTNNVFSIQCSGWVDNVPTKVKFLSTSSDSTFGSSTRPSKINDLNPSSLGMPDLSNGIDISSYITHLDKVVNSYTPSVNGWISIRVKKTSLAHASLMMYQTGGLLSSCETDEFNISGTNLPVIANQNVEIYIIADALASAKFFPCQGNV